MRRPRLPNPNEMQSAHSLQRFVGLSRRKTSEKKSENNACNRLRQIKMTEAEATDRQNGLWSLCCNMTPNCGTRPEAE